MGWNGSGQKGATPAQPKKVTQKKPSPFRGLVAGAVVVVLAGAAYFAFFSGSEKPQKAESDKKPGRIKEVTPAPTPKAAVERKEVEKPAPKAGKEPDTNIVWISKTRYITRRPNGESITIIVDNPDEPRKQPIFEVGLNNFLTNFTTPGEFVPETPMEVSNDEVMQALMEKIEIKDDDSEEVRFQKESVALLREELRDYIKGGRTTADFIRDIQRRQQMEAEHVREAKSMIMDSLANDDPAQARDLYDAINKHMNEKGLPKVRLHKKFLKMMEVTE